MKITEATNDFKTVTSVYVRDNSGDVARVYCRFSDGLIYVDDRTGKYHEIDRTTLKELTGPAVKAYEEKVYRSEF
jgi:hypothetical protein